MSDFIKSTRIIENTWTCTSCQTKNLGRYMQCQKCGSNKEFDEVDEVPTDTANAPTVTDPELLKQANAGEDWMCEYCMGRVRNSNGDCHNCAAKRDPFNSRIQKIADSTPDDYEEPTGVLAARPPKKYPFKKLLSILAGVVLAGLLFWALFPKSIYGTVSSTEWTYTTIAFKRQLNHGSGWGHSSESFNVQCERKFKEMENCNPYQCRPHQVSYKCRCSNYQCNPRQDSYSCNCTSRSCNCRESCSSNGNGYSTCRTVCSTCSSCSTCYRTVYSTCERCDTCYRTEYDTCYRQCPVYDNWCSYDYYTWPEFKRQSFNGNGTNPTFPEFVAPDKETYKTKNVEEYVVMFSVDKGKEKFIYRPKNLEEYKRFFTGKTWELKKNLLGISVVYEDKK